MAIEIRTGRKDCAFAETAFLQYEFYDTDKQFIDMKEEIETK
jgi:hypothetical protein